MLCAGRIQAEYVPQGARAAQEGATPPGGVRAILRNSHDGPSQQRH